MASVCVERLDHLGMVASVIKERGIVEKVDARLGLHDHEEITAGEAIAGMILNGLGFSDRPLTLTPQFFVNKPLDLLFRESVRAEMFNRFKLGRTLDEAHAYGCDLLFSEGGFCFLKDPQFFVSSLFVKNPSRIQGLLMVMTLAMLVYSVAQRRLRRELSSQNETIPNQINQPTSRPTLRWVFQVLEGIERVRVTVEGEGHDVITGLHAVKIKILRLFGEPVCHMYQLPSG